MAITERVELHDGAIRLAAQVSRPNTQGPTRLLSSPQAARSRARSWPTIGSRAAWPMPGMLRCVA
jgi:hypothetical protein